MREQFHKLFKHFANADRMEHAGYLFCMALMEHSALKILALLVLGGIVIAAWISHD